MIAMVGGTTLAATIQSDKLKEIHFEGNFGKFVGTLLLLVSDTLLRLTCNFLLFIL